MEVNKILFALIAVKIRSVKNVATTISEYRCEEVLVDGGTRFNSFREPIWNVELFTERNAGSQITDPAQVCRKVKRLRGRMEKICKGNKEVYKKIIEGVTLGIHECQHQFKDKQWNCSDDKVSLSKLLQKDTRETGFLHAVTSAGVAYSVTMACASGRLVECSCDQVSERQKHKLPQAPRDQGDWRWGGCGDNIEFGYKKSKMFMDFPNPKRRDLKTLIRLHNNEAGRLALKNHMRTDCKCHGPSGTCTIRTCWRKMPSFREVGKRLSRKFNVAAEVVPSNDGRSFMLARQDEVKNQDRKKPAKKGLVYADKSPNFCYADRRTGSLGTSGRQCNITGLPNNCEYLCCSRGYSVKEIKTFSLCHCKLSNFEVQCKQCPQHHLVYTCL